MAQVIAHRGDSGPALENILLNVDFQTSDGVAPGLAVVRDAEPSGDVVISGLRVKCLQIVAAATSRITTLLSLDDLPAGIDPAEARAVADVNLHNSLVDAALVARAGTQGWVCGSSSSAMSNGSRS